MNDEPFKPITRAQAAEILSVSISTLEALIKKGALPAPRKLKGTRLLYWHPKVFYAPLHRALAGEEPGTQQPAEPPNSSFGTYTRVSSPDTPGSSDRPRGPEAAPSLEEPTQEAPKPERKRGSADARARQAARIRKFNEEGTGPVGHPSRPAARED